MLTQALYLAIAWFGISLLITLMAGHLLRYVSSLFSLIWLLLIIGVGDVWAYIAQYPVNELIAFSVIGIVLGLFWIRQFRDWNSLAQVTWTMATLSTILFIMYSFTLTAFSPLNPLSFLFAMMFFFIEAITMLMALVHLHESLDVTCRVRWHRLVTKLNPVPGYEPMVSLHIPAYNEPVHVVQQTLVSLARMDYYNYEVIVVDNNTPAEETWRPLEEFCRNLGPRFHCLHLDNWPGYKSGALNFALTQTDPRAEIIGIIDADYQVDEDFLKELVPAFADRELAFVQTPQDYVDYERDVFSASTYFGYRYFFEVSMPARNERNAIIFAGTMGLIRKSVIESIGGWDEWCITEDAEASLRILKRGYKSLYVKRPFGRGLMPFDFEGLKKQRFRWCFGGIQILKKHWEALMPWARWVDPTNKLTLAQRYYYLVGGLGWYTDFFNLLFAFFLVLGAIFSLLASPVQIRPLTNTIIILPAIFLFLHILRFIWVLRHRLNLSFGMAIATMHNFFSLGWAVTLACFQGMIQKEGVFLRTPKSNTSSRIWHALRATQWESVIGLVCATAGSLAFIASPNWRTFGLCSLLYWQGSLYLAAPIYSLISTRKQAPYAAQITDQGRPIQENSAARWAVGFLVGALFALSLIRILPVPSAATWYTRFMPIDIGLSLNQPFGITLRPTSTPSSPLTDSSVPMTTILASVDCRAAPQERSHSFAVLENGQSFQIVGRNNDSSNPWWQIVIPDHNRKCWVPASNTHSVGPLDNVPTIDHP